MWAAERYYELLGTTFHVRAEVAEVGDEVDRLLSLFRHERTGVPGPRRYSLVSGERRPDGLHRLYRDCAASARGEEWGPVIAGLLAELNLAAVGEFPGFAAHSGAVASGGRVVAFPAVSEEGKSTLTAACVLAGFDYVSDEALCIEFGSARVIPYQKPVMLSRHSFELLGLAPHPQHRSDRDEAALLPEDLGGAVAEGELRLTDVIQLARGSAPLRLESLPRSETLAHLLRMSFNHYKRPHDAFLLATRLAQECRAWRLHFDDPREAAELLMEQLGALSRAESRAR